MLGGGPYDGHCQRRGEYTSPDVKVTEAGFYVWVAAYSGDDNNEPATHACGQVEETVTRSTPPSRRSRPPRSRAR